MPAQEIIDQQRREFGFPAQKQVPVSSGAVVQLDFSTGAVQQILLTANCLVAQPINPPDVGGRVVLIFTQDSVGSRSLSWGVAFRDAPSWSAGAANTRASATFIYDGFSFQYEGGSTAFATSGLGVVPSSGGIGLVSDVPAAKTNPAPSVGAMALTGVASTLTSNTIVVRAPTVGALTAAGVAPLPSVLLTPPGAALVTQGQAATRNP